MPNYTDLISVAVNMPDKAVSLSGAGIAFILTALGEYLEKHENWRGSGEFGVLTDNQADYVDAVIAFTERSLMGNLTGTYIMSAVPVEGALECDGATYNRVDYPELYAAFVDTVYIVDEDTFVVPDLIEAFPLGSTIVGTTGGETDHTLTPEEMPSHGHSVDGTVTAALIPVGLEAAVTLGVPSIGFTDNAGGGVSHNNMPPFHSVRFFIWT